MDATPLDIIKEEQFNKLKETLTRGYEHTRYYKKLFDQCGFDVYNFKDTEEMKKIPLLTRTDIDANFDELQADDISDYYLSMSGGSSGTSLKVLLDKELVYRERAFIYHFWSKAGYDYKTSKIASFRGGIDFGSKLNKYNPIYNEIQLNPCAINAGSIRRYVYLINKFNADFIHGHPSAVYSFCKYAKEAGINLKNRFKATLFISENIYDYQRDFIEKTLGIKSYAYYGHTERSVFAEQVSEGYRFNHYYCFTELCRQPGSSVVTTGFLNQKMPLIRYELDDSTSYLSEHDSYLITGHRDGILYGKNGEIISAATLYIHNNILDKVANQQFVQEEHGKAKMLICPINELGESDRKIIERYYQDKLGEAIDIEVEINKDLIFTKRGKLPLIVQRCV